MHNHHMMQSRSSRTSVCGIPLSGGLPCCNSCLPSRKLAVLTLLITIDHWHHVFHRFDKARWLQKANEKSLGAFSSKGLSHSTLTTHILCDFVVCLLADFC